MISTCTPKSFIHQLNSKRDKGNLTGSGVKLSKKLAVASTLIYEIFLVKPKRCPNLPLGSTMRARCVTNHRASTSPCHQLPLSVYYKKFGWEVDLVEQFNFPKCQKCKVGDLVPLSDFGSQGAAIHYKAWVCTNPDCGFNLKIRNGDVYVNEPIMSGSLHSARSR